MSWYTGENGTDPARGTAVARIDQSITVQYGARANEQALRYQLQNIAVYAAVTTNATNPNASAQVSALQQRIATNLAPQFGQQSIQDMQAEFAGAQTAIKAATDRQTPAQGRWRRRCWTAIEGINQDEVATKILALQTNLQASYQTTSMLYQTIADQVPADLASGIDVATKRKRPPAGGLFRSLDAAQLCRFAVRGVGACRSRALSSSSSSWPISFFASFSA